VEAIEVAGLVVHKGTVSHSLLGHAHVIEHAGRPITAMSAIDWSRPTQIPTIAEPRALPPGTGTLLLNEIATRALAAGVQKLRYAGPYPTHALFVSLLRSFRTTDGLETFTADVLDRALRVARDEVAVDFTPAPFVRSRTAYGYLDLRDGVADRVQIDGVVYDHHEQPGSLARLDGVRAVLTVGGPIAAIATFDAKLELADGPHPIPAFQTAANGTEFPAALRDELAEAATVFVPAPLASDVVAAIRPRRIEWADLGWRAARRIGDGFSMHVGFLALGKDHMDLFAQRLSYHLATIAQQTVLDELLASRRR
jgi:hypothetical protein